MADTLLRERYARVLDRIDAACAAAGRPRESVRLIAVSKLHPAASLAEVAAAGQIDFGENYVQEFADKVAELADLDLEWHFIGPLQSNKTRPVAEAAHWVHTLDRLKIAERLSAQRPADLPPLNVCVQVNVSGETSKHGVNLADVPALARAVAALPRLRLRGLMTIPEASPDLDLLASRFASLRQCLAALNAEGLALDTLSMGMSADMDLALAEGATLVRVGTAIFGERDYPAAKG